MPSRATLSALLLAATLAFLTLLALLHFLRRRHYLRRATHLLHADALPSRPHPRRPPRAVAPPRELLDRVAPVYRTARPRTGDGFDGSQTRLARARDCAICLEGFAEDAPRRKLPCGHRFHALCIEGWFGKGADCPECRQRVYETVADVVPARPSLPPLDGDALRRMEVCELRRLVRAADAVLWDGAGRGGASRLAFGRGASEAA